MATHYRGSREETRALDVFIKLMRASDSVASRLGRNLSELKLTPGQFGILETLLHLGPMCQAELGRKQLRSSGNVTMVVDNLEKHGLVQRRREGSDRRFVTVHLTPAGRRRIEDAFPRHLACIVQELKALSPAEQQQMELLLRKLGKGKTPDAAPYSSRRRK